MAVGKKKRQIKLYQPFEFLSQLFFSALICFFFLLSSPQYLYYTKKKKAKNNLLFYYGHYRQKKLFQIAQKNYLLNIKKIMLITDKYVLSSIF